MRYLVIMIIGILIMGCVKFNNVTPGSKLDPECITVVEGCQYFVVEASSSYTYIHKGNCNNPIHIYK